MRQYNDHIYVGEEGPFFSNDNFHDPYIIVSLQSVGKKVQPCQRFQIISAIFVLKLLKSAIEHLFSYLEIKM